MLEGQHTQFAERIKRIETGTSANTFATVYTGVQDVDTPRSKKVSGVQRHKIEEAKGPSVSELVQFGLRSGLLKLIVLGSGLALYLTYIAG